MLETLLSWLRGIPGLQDMTAEYLGPEEGAAGLFCRGREVLWQRRDILGALTCRQRAVFLLSIRSPDPALLSLTLTVEPEFRSIAPVFGLDQTLKLEQGRTVRNDGGGLPVIEARLTLEYTTKEE